MIENKFWSSIDILKKVRFLICGSWNHTLDGVTTGTRLLLAIFADVLVTLVYLYYRFDDVPSQSATFRKRIKAFGIHWKCIYFFNNHFWLFPEFFFAQILRDLTALNSFDISIKRLKLTWDKNDEIYQHLTVFYL